MFCTEMTFVRGNSPQSGTQIVPVPTPPPVPVNDPPSDLFITTYSMSSATMTWNDNSDEETGFEVYRAVDGGAFALDGTVGANVETYTSSIAPNHNYDFKVRAVFAVGQSDWSNTVSVSTFPE
jgi:hypothetical protein